MVIGMIALATWFQRPPAAPQDGTVPLTPTELEDVVRLWNSGTVGRTQVRDSLENPEARLLVVRTLLDSAGAPDMEICRLLDDAGARSWCQSTINRPHLYEAPMASSPTRVRPGGGPVDTQLLASRDLMDVQPVGPPPTCPGHGASRVCAAEAAIEAGVAADAGAVREACLHIEAGRWRDECVFMAAEQMYKRHGDTALAGAAWLCSRAGRYTHHCLKRVIEGLAAKSVPADESMGWQMVTARARAFHAGIAASDPILASQTIDWYYAEALDQSYAKARIIQGTPLAFLPPEAHPHVRAAAIERLVQASPSTDRTLAQWVQAIERVMTSQTPAEPPLAPAAIDTHPVYDLWRADAPTEAKVRAVYWRSAARRVVSDDPVHDRLICLMESLARTNRPARAELATLTEHPDEAVHLTARRLVRQQTLNGG